MNKSEEQFPQGVPTLVDTLNSGKSPKPVDKGIPNLVDMYGDK